MPAGTATALQTGNPALGTVSRRPQTTAPAADPSVPFIRLSRRAKILGYSTSGVAFGGTITQPLKAAGGYLRGLKIRVTATGGVNGTTTVAIAADAPWSAIGSIFLRDPLGQPVYQSNGYDLQLVNLFSGQCGNAGFQNPANAPTYSAPSVGSSGTGNFEFELFLPMEFDSAAYCCLASMNASSQPSLLINVGASTAVYTTAPGTLPTMRFDVTEEFWATPISAPSLAPPQVGSSAQWSEAQCAQGIGSGAYVQVVWPRVGTYVHTLIGVLRDSTNARIAAFPASDLALRVDGVPVIMERYEDRQDDVYKAFGITLPTGVIVYTFRQSVAEEVRQDDTHDVLLPTTPATLLEIAGTWGTVSNAPAQLTAVTGELYPVGGIPYTHLAQ